MTLTVSIGTKFDRPQQYLSASMPRSAGERGKTRNIAHNMHFGGVKGQIHPIIDTSEAENGVHGSPVPTTTGSLG